jgi:hypothetical protein
MDKSQIAIFAAVIVALGVRLYKYYVKKNNEKTGTQNKASSTSFPSGSKEDEYEPYSKN